MNRRRAARFLGKTLAYAALLVISYVVCFPLIWALSTSLKPPAELAARTPTVIPQAFTGENYRHLVTGKRQYADPGAGDYKPSSAPPQ